VLLRLGTEILVRSSVRLSLRCNNPTATKHRVAASTGSGANSKAHRVQWSFGNPRGVVIKLSSFEELFAGRHFDREVIILCVRWYLRYNSASGTWSK
jgi:hypothetical protein